MKMKLFVPGIISALALVLSAQVPGPDIHPGLWEITTETEVVGMPNMSPPPQTHTQCITMESLVPQSEEASQECQVSDLEVDGNTVSWKIVCSGETGGMEGTGSITYSGDTMEGTMEMVITGSPMQVKNTIRGRRIGECEGTGS